MLGSLVVQHKRSMVLMYIHTQHTYLHTYMYIHEHMYMYIHTLQTFSKKKRMRPPQGFGRRVKVVKSSIDSQRMNVPSKQ
jgi:hypothetical protein